MRIRIKFAIFSNLVLTGLVMSSPAITTAQTIDACPYPYQIFNSTYTLKHVFDCLDQSINQGDGYKNSNNESGQLVWLESRIMLAYLRIYQATNDIKYLYKYIDHADAVLSKRDSELGKVTYDNLSQPVWGTDGHATISQPLILKDAQDNPGLEIIGNAPSYNNETYVTVESGTQPQTYKLTAINNTLSSRSPQVFDNLTQASVEAVINSVTDHRKRLIKVRVLGNDPPQYQTSPELTTQRIVMLLHTGRITEHLAMFAYLVKSDPSLNQGLFLNKAAQYLNAAIAALEIHKNEWEEIGNRGYYRFTKGSPFWADGIVVPHNQYLSAGLTYLNLFLATGNTSYRDKVIQMANNFKYCSLDPTYDKRACLRTIDNGSYIWPYWWAEGALGWKAESGLSINTKEATMPPTVEDTGHGAIDLALAYEAFANDMGITAEDIGRFNLTVKNNILSKLPNFPDKVDGTGSFLAGLSDLSGLALAGLYDPEIIDIVKGFASTTDYRVDTNSRPLLMQSLAEIAYVFKRTNQLPLAGDTNNDRLADFIDYQVWQNNYAQFSNQGQTAGDFNFDQKSNVFDFGIWRK